MVENLKKCFEVYLPFFVDVSFKNSVKLLRQVCSHSKRLSWFNISRIWAKISPLLAPILFVPRKSFVLQSPRAFLLTNSLFYTSFLFKFPLTCKSSRFKFFTEIFSFHGFSRTVFVKNWNFRWEGFWACTFRLFQFNYEKFRTRGYW